jgi:hypothetical protein
MARARTIKPGFFTNDTLAEIPPLGRLLFAGLWTIADRAGRLEDRPRKIKAEILPYDECDVDTLLEDLAERDFIIRYEHGGVRYVQVMKFEQHQNPHKNEGASRIPSPNSHSSSTVQAPEQHHTSTVQAPCEDGTTHADHRSTDLQITDHRPQVTEGEPAPAGASDGADAPPTPDEPVVPDEVPTEPPKRRRRLPGDFVPSAALTTWAEQDLRLDPATIEYETEKFCDHFRGSGATKLDWPLTWKNWMRRAAEGTFSRGRASPGKSMHSPANLSNEELLDIIEGRVAI